MRKAFNLIASATIAGVLATGAQADNSQCFENAFGDEYKKAYTIAIAEKALDHAFDKNPSLKSTENLLRGYLDALPDASQAERERIHKQAYDLRVQMERDNYKYYIVQAVHAVAMAAQTATDVNYNQFRRVTGHPVDVSLELTEDAFESVLIYDMGRRKLSEIRDIERQTHQDISEDLLCLD